MLMNAGVYGELIKSVKRIWMMSAACILCPFGSKGIVDVLMESQLQTTPTDQVFSLETNGKFDTLLNFCK